MECTAKFGLLQEFEDEKIQLSNSLMEYIENRTKRLDSDRENLGKPKAKANICVGVGNDSTRYLARWRKVTYMLIDLFVLRYYRFASGNMCVCVW